MRVCNCSMFCCTLLYVPSSFAIILMWKRELVALLSLSSWYLVIVLWLFLAVPWVHLQFVIVVFPDHTHYFIPRYEVYRGYIIFAFSVIMFVCLSVCLSVCKLFFRQRFLSNYLG